MATTWVAGFKEHNWLKEHEFNDFMESTNSKAKKQNKHLNKERSTKNVPVKVGLKSYLCFETNNFISNTDELTTTTNGLSTTSHS